MIARCYNQNVLIGVTSQGVFDSFFHSQKVLMFVLSWIFLGLTLEVVSRVNFVNNHRNILTFLKPFYLYKT